MQHNRMQPVKIIDAFTFYNEIDLLNYRLNLLDDVVDYFVIVEATRTFKGEEKPLFFQMHKQQFAKFMHKIIYVIVDDLVFRPVVFSHELNDRTNKYWKNEHYQRNCIKRGIEQLKLNEHDYIVISDVDEIPNPETLQKIKKLQKHEYIDFVNLTQSLYYYNLNSMIKSTLEHGEDKWTFAKIVSYNCFVTKYNSNANDCRVKQLNNNAIMNGGWHLSHFGSPEFIKNKIQQLSHQELNVPKIANIEHIKHCIDNKIIYYHSLNVNSDLYILDVPTSQNDNLPPMYNIYLTKYYRNN